MFSQVCDQRTIRVFRRIVEKQIGLQPGENALVVADAATEEQKIVALISAINYAGGIPSLAIEPWAGWKKDDPYAVTPAIRAAYPAADVVICASLSSAASLYGRPQEFRDLQARREKVRMFSLVERSLDIILADTADYDEIKRNNEKIKNILKKSKKVFISSPNGTEFEGAANPIDYDRLWPHLSHEGFALKPGDFGGCPDGEVHIPCPIDSMNGTVVADGPVANICAPRPDQPIRISVEKARIKKISGGKDAAKLAKLVEDLGQDWVSEIGLGTNPAWIWSDSLNGVKKGLGNLHVAYGGWWGFQPDIPYKVHGDMVICEGRYEVDGKVILENGKLFLD